jgi:uncharacterized protein (TIGR03118 family)
MKPLFASTFAAVLLAGTALSVQAAPPPATGGFFQVHRKVADTDGQGQITDTDLINSWGIAQAPGGPIWVADAGTGVSTVYDRKTFDKQGLTVTIPAPGGAGPSLPTGTVFSSFSSSDFPVSSGPASGGSYFLFATIRGVIAGWNPTVDATHAIIAVDDSGEGAAYTGATIAHKGEQARLYVADFANNEVAIYGPDFAEIGDFTDPDVPAGYAPFNVQALNNRIYVTFALRDPDEGDEVAGPGLGYVDVFDTSGRMLKRLVSNGALNAPWGLVTAPAGFGRFSGQLLVGNFGDGRINAYDKDTGAFLGKVRGADGVPITIDGLWSLMPGAGKTLSFASGPRDERHGLVGQIEFNRGGGG